MIKIRMWLNRFFVILGILLFASVVVDAWCVEFLGEFVSGLFMGLSSACWFLGLSGKLSTNVLKSEAINNLIIKTEEN